MFKKYENIDTDLRIRNPEGAPGKILQMCDAGMHRHPGVGLFQNSANLFGNGTIRRVRAAFKIAVHFA